MKTLILAFTLKGQSESEILQVVKEIADRNPNSILIHGFLPRKVVVEKGFSTTVVDALEKNFPVQLNMWNEKPLRNEMVDIAKRLGAEIFVIGDIKEGVEEEVNLYKEAGMTFTQFALSSPVAQ